MKSSRLATRRAERGFTILEIMIAAAILTVGLVGILALFPVAINYGRQIVEKSTSIMIAESVAEAMREGLRNNLRTINRGNATHHYFIFRHDGVMDPVPISQAEQDRSYDKDFFILLPRYHSGREGTFSSPEMAIRNAKTFLYPETDSPPNGAGNAFEADDDGDDQTIRLSDGEVQTDVLVTRTYSLGNTLPAADATGERILDDQKIDSLKQYSFAFEIQASLYDANLNWQGKAYQPANVFYRVRVMIFRGFSPPASADAVPRTPEFTLDFEVSI